MALAACGRMPAVDSTASSPTAQTQTQTLSANSPSTDPASPGLAAQDAIELAGGPPPSDPIPPPVWTTDEAAPAQGVAVDATAATDAGPPIKVQDPLESVNRKLFEVDATLDKVRARLPVQRVAARCTPKPLSAGLANVMANLQEPTTFANQILQRKIAGAARTAVRFVFNSTAGLFGIFNPAKKAGLDRVKTNFGQTLATYGVGAGPYLYVPIAGPMTLRDVAGIVADGYITPFAWLRLTEAERRAMQAANLANKATNAEIRTAARQASPVVSSRDEYAAVRLMHYQQQAAQTGAADPKPPSRPLQVASTQQR
jgi:phospholipid-binding lipoprotein MlaA